MKKIKVLLILISVLVAGLAATDYASATPSAGFDEVNGEVFDEWGICRTRAFGEDGFYQLTETGFRPVIAFECLGEDANLAYSLGKQIAQQYPDRVRAAEEVFHFVRNRVHYTSDVDQFEYDEFAQNADETATAIEEKGVGYGDCEDSAVLLAIMFKGAGYRSAIAIGSGHTATLVYLPDYTKPTAVFELDGEPGWVWAEATGKNNPLGWTSKEFINVELAAYEIEEETIARLEPPAVPATAVAKTGRSSSGLPFPFFGVIALLWFISLFRKRGKA